MANENMDMKRMQQEAIHRVQEMQSQANQKLHGKPPFSSPARGNRPNAESRVSANHTANHVKKTSDAHNRAEQMDNSAYNQEQEIIQTEHESAPAKQKNIVENVIDGVMKDSERTLIMILLLLLFNEKADNSAIFSLLYLLL